MILKKLMDEDFVNYKKPSMVLGFPNCSFKCDKECGMNVCQNSALARAPEIEVSTRDVVDRYMNNPITSAVVVQGLEPLDDLEQLKKFIVMFRNKTKDDIVIYTGYNKEEDICLNFRFWIKDTGIKNIVIKFGRFIPNAPSVFDQILGVVLASENQMAVRIN